MEPLFLFPLGLFFLKKANYLKLNTNILFLNGHSNVFHNIKIIFFIKINFFLLFWERME